MADWADTVSELATGVGTLVLAVATFAAVRSSNRSARTAETAMQAGMRPILMHSRLTDPGQKLAFGDGRWVSVPGGAAAVQASGGVVYLAVSVRNCGTGMAILHGWRAGVGRPDARSAAAPVEAFTPQTRDMYVAASDLGFWQGALRDPAQPGYADVTAAVAACEPVWVELLYGDFEGGQRVISRFNLNYRDGSDIHGHRPPDGESPPRGRWLASVIRHWNVDRPDPR